MTVDSSPVKFTPALPGQPVPEIRTMAVGGRSSGPSYPTAASSGWSAAMRTSGR